MNTLAIGVLCLIGGAVVGILALYFYRQTLDNKTRNRAQNEAGRIINKAKSEANRMARDAQNKAKDFESRARRNLENDLRKEKQKEPHRAQASLWRYDSQNPRSSNLRASSSDQRLCRVR